MKKVLVDFCLLIVLIVLWGVTQASADEMEIEDNNTWSKATPITLGQNYTGSIGDWDDIDFYSITMEYGRMYRIYVDGYNKDFSSESLEIVLQTEKDADSFDPNSFHFYGKIISQNMKNQGVDFYDTTGMGKYAILFHNYSGVTKEYNLRVEDIGSYNYGNSILAPKKYSEFTIVQEGNGQNTVFDYRLIVESAATYRLFVKDFNKELDSMLISLAIKGKNKLGEYKDIIIPVSEVMKETGNDYIEFDAPVFFTQTDEIELRFANSGTIQGFTFWFSKVLNEGQSVTIITDKGEKIVRTKNNDGTADIVFTCGRVEGRLNISETGQLKDGEANVKYQSWKIGETALVDIIKSINSVSFGNDLDVRMTIIDKTISFNSSLSKAKGSIAVNSENKTFAIVDFDGLVSIINELKEGDYYLDIPIVKLSKDKVELKLGDKCEISLMGTTQIVKWKSNNKSVVTVNKSGVIKAKKTGEAIITGKLGKKKYKCQVIVSK